MPDIVRRELYGPGGERLVTLRGSEDPSPLFKHPLVNENRALARLCGAEPDSAGPSASRSDVLSTAIQLGFVARSPLKGFLTTLPRGALVDRCVDTFNEPHVRELDAVRMEFPQIFPRNDERLAELTADYEAQGRMFALDGRDQDLRLAYAADPGYLGWLAGARIRDSELPYAVYSPMRVFRRWLPGELGGFDRLREYTLPDLHILVRPEDAVSAATRYMRVAADGSRFWGGADTAPFLEIVRGYAEAHPTFASDVAVATARPLLVTLLEQPSRYYAVKGGVLVEAGFGNVMLYNLQIDETNGPRFDIRTRAGSDVTIVHGTLAGGCAKVLPIVVGRALCGLAPRAIPPEIAASQILCVPLRDEHLDRARGYVEDLRARGVRGSVDPRTDRSLGKRVRFLREAWQPYHTVFGDREATSDPLVSSTATGARTTLDEWLAAYGARVERCAPPGGAHVPQDPPF